jgi:hypothetical protein
MSSSRDDEKKDPKEHWLQKYGKAISVDIIIGIVLLVVVGGGLVKCS